MSYPPFTTWPPFVETPTPNAIVSEQVALAYAANVTLDTSLGNDFAIDTLTGNVIVTWDSVTLNKQGSLIVRQDAVGGRTVTFTAPGGWTLMRDAAIPNLNANSPANAYTIYTWMFTGVSTQILVMTKLFPV